MDPTHHEKIVDKLMQYRGKIPKDGHLVDVKAKELMTIIRNDIDDMIHLIETVAVHFRKGLIR